MNRPRVAPDAALLRAAGATVAVLGFPWDGTCISRPGTQLGPRGLREASEQFLSYNANSGVDLNTAFNIVDCGDVAVVPGNPARTQDRAEAATAEILAADAIPVVLGGEHSITIGPSRAFAKKYARCGMIHFDTHFDTAEEIGGEPLSHCCPVARAVDAGFNPRKIVTIGPSGWLNPPSELEYVKKAGITLFTLDDVCALGPQAIVEGTREVMTDLDAIYLTVDIDVLDAAYAPGTGVPTPSGMTSREILTIISGFRRLPIRAVDVAEVSPPWDPSGITSRLGVRILLEALSAIALGRR
ncbi:agmatinase family protein [Sphingomonas flavalba]|uniref:agmatinase family protein n=1 Tax=Sphingomonas flavalba TaxID=2559804 RepID=UPI0039E1ED50